MAVDFNTSKRSNFLGHDGFIWWIGVVENRNDPLHLGRCQVRIKGLHSETKTSIPSGDLPWAQPLFSVNGSVSTPTTLKDGDIVMGFFMDGDGAQFPIIMGMFHGIPEDTPNGETGFNDQRTSDQLKSSPRKPKSIEYKTDGSGATITEQDQASAYPNRLDEPTTSRLSRNESIDETIVKTKKDSLVKSIPDATGGNWNEPEVPYNTKYPFNQVTSTEAGHYLELDDTPGAERIHLYHRSGTFDEIHPNGSKVEKIVKDKYTIIMKDDNVYIMGDCSITVQGNAKVYVKKDCDLKVDQNLNFNVKGDWSVKIGGKWTTNVGSTVAHKSGGDTSINAPTIHLN